MTSIMQEQCIHDEESPLMASDKHANYSDRTILTANTLYSDEETLNDEEDPGLFNSTHGDSKEQKEVSRLPQHRSTLKLVVFQAGHDEESPLYKANINTNNNYSFRTARTVGTSGSDEDVLGDDQQEQTTTVLGSMVVFQTEEARNVRFGQEVVDASLVEDVVEEVVHDVAEALMEELHDVDETDGHFLEIGLTRNFSILPSDIAVAATEQPPPAPPPDDGDIPEDLEALTTDSTAKEVATTPLSAYVLLLGAIVSLSSIGPLLQLQQGASGTLKVVWRMAGTSIFLFPFAITEVYRNGLPRLNTAQWVTFFLSTACYDILCVGFVLALDYTAVGNAVILSNSLALILLVGKLFVGDPVSFLEGMGALVAFSGAALCSRDSAEAHGPTAGGGSAYLGDALAILSAFGGVGYLICAKSSRAHVPLYQFMFLTMFFGCIMIVLFEIFAMGERVTFDRHPTHGLWGWLLLESDRLPLEIFIVIVCNGLGTMGYIRAMQYFDSLVISSAALAEPVVAELMAFAFGVGALPGFQGWMGNFLVVLGTLAVILEDSHRNKDGGKSLH